MAAPAALRRHLLATPVGPFAVIEAADGSIRTEWWNGEVTPDDPGDADGGPAPALVGALRRYLGGAAETFGEIPTPSGPAFHRRCWTACRAIPRGATCSYAELAVAAGGTTAAARAAGQAMRHNPLPIIVPCHRVIAAGGDLHGYAGSRDGHGLPLAVKRFLLDLEGARPGNPAAQILLW